MLRKSILPLAFVSLLIPCVTAQSVDEIITKNIEAKGGLDAIRAVNATRASGTMAFAGMAEGTLEVTLARPHLIRVNVNMLGSPSTQGFDGEDAWQVMPALLGGNGMPQDMPEKQAVSFKDGADLDGPLVDYKKKGHTVELVGTETTNGAEMYHLKATLKSGRIIHMYLDTKEYLERKVRSTDFNPQMGTDVETEQYFGDYKKVGGVLVPHSIDVKMQGQTLVSMTIKSVDINPDIDESFFKRPSS